MLRMIDSKNVTLNNEKNLAPDPFLITYGNKYVELEVTKDAISMYRDSLLEKKKILEEEKRELEELNYQVWSLEDSLCEQIWRFSHEHDFFIIFQYHPFVVNCTKRRSCRDIERNCELIDLTNEIDAIKAEMIDLNQGWNIKREVESALTKLRKLQLISDDVTELLRLIRPSQSSCKFETISMPIYDEIIVNNGNKVKRRKNNDPGCAKEAKKSNFIPKKKLVVLKNDKSDFVPKKKLILTIPKNYPELSLEKNVIFTANTMITNASVESTSNKKFRNFTLKKRSEISIKFQQYREHKRINYN